MPTISLSAIRVNASLSQTDLATKLDVHRTTVINWETGKTKIATPWLMAFCKECDNFPIDYARLPERA